MNWHGNKKWLELHWQEVFHLIALILGLYGTVYLAYSVTGSSGYSLSADGNTKYHVAVIIEAYFNRGIHLVRLSYILELIVAAIGLLNLYTQRRKQSIDR